MNPIVHSAIVFKWSTLAGLTLEFQVFDTMIIF